MSQDEKKPSVVVAEQAVLEVEVEETDEADDCASTSPPGPVTPVPVPPN